MAGVDESVLQSVEKEFSKVVKLQVEKKVSVFLGINIGADDNGINNSNSLLIESISRLFFMAEAKASPTPISAGTRIDKYEDSPNQ